MTLKKWVFVLTLLGTVSINSSSAFGAGDPVYWGCLTRCWNEYKNDSAKLNECRKDCGAPFIPATATESYFVVESSVGRCSLLNDDCDRLIDNLEVAVEERARERCLPLLSEREADFKVARQLAKPTFDYPYDIQVSATFRCHN